MKRDCRLSSCKHEHNDNLRHLYKKEDIPQIFSFIIIIFFFFFFFFFFEFRCYDLVIIVEQLLLVTEVVNGAFLTSLTHSKLTDENFLYCYWAHIIFVVDSVFNC